MYVESYKAKPSIGTSQHNSAVKPADQQLSRPALSVAKSSRPLGRTGPTGETTVSAGGMGKSILFRGEMI